MWHCGVAPNISVAFCWVNESRRATIAMGLNIDFKLLPMKAHYFLYNAGMTVAHRRRMTKACDTSVNACVFVSIQLNANFNTFELWNRFLSVLLYGLGTGSVVPFMPVFARQLGFSTFVVGTIYSILPILGLVAKPFFGAIADKWVQLQLFQWKNVWVSFSISFTDTNATSRCSYFSSCWRLSHSHRSNSFRPFQRQRNWNSIAMMASPIFDIVPEQWIIVVWIEWKMVRVAELKLDST